MNNTTQTEPTDKTATLTELIVDLAPVLQRYTDQDRDEIPVVHSMFQGDIARENEAFIELDVQEQRPDLSRALWTILQQTGGVIRWLHGGEPDEQNPCDGPVAFAILKQTYGPGPKEFHQFLWCYCGGDFDRGAVARQLNNLIKLISDPANLVPLTPERHLAL
jgi:hypothetical protein